MAAWFHEGRWVCHLPFFIPLKRKRGGDNVVDHSSNGALAVAASRSGGYQPLRAAPERIRGVKESLTGSASYPFILIDKTRDALLGMCGVHPRLDFMLGYWIAKPYWGRGYATEAVRRVAKFAFDELGTNQLTASWILDNPASGRVLEKIGFKPNGTEERDCLSRGTTVFCHKVVLNRVDFERLE
jgi:RimJ/RimL family protein N-acetyltransferase